MAEVENMLEQVEDLLVDIKDNLARLSRVCDALKAQLNMKDKENILKLHEETQKRIDIAIDFEITRIELTKLIETHSNHNKQLREENIAMAAKLQELQKDFDGRDSEVKMVN